MDEEEVREYVERIQSLIEDSPQMDEANTKAAVLRDFLDLLGWEIPTNTRLEYSVEAFGKTYKVDYALVLEGTPVAFLEAKGVDTSLTSKHRDQLRAYLKNEDVNLGVLTNGREYEFFRRRVVDSKVNVEIPARITLQNLPDRVGLLRAFTKSAIEGDEWLKILNRIKELEAAQTELVNRKDELAAELATLLVDSVSETISAHANSQAKEMIDRLIGEIEEEIDDDGTDVSASPIGRDTSPTQSDSVPKTDGYLVKFSNTDSHLRTFVDGTQKGVMGKATDYLIESHDLISKIAPLPYIPGRSKAIINDEPSSPHDDQAMRDYQELTDGYYLDTHMNRSGKKRELRRLAKECNLEVEFGGEW